MRSVRKDNSNSGSKNDGNTKKSGTGTPEERHNDLEWALFLLVFKQNTNAKQNSKGEFPQSTMSESREASSLLADARSTQLVIVKSIIIIQSTFKMRPHRGSFSKLKRSAKFIQKFYRGRVILRTYRDIYREVLTVVKGKVRK